MMQSYVVFDAIQRSRLLPFQSWALNAGKTRTVRDRQEKSVKRQLEVNEGMSVDDIRFRPVRHQAIKTV